MARFQERLNSQRLTSNEIITAEVLQDLESFGEGGMHQDDISMLIVEFKGKTISNP